MLAAAAANSVAFGKRSLPINAVRIQKTSVNTTYFADAL